MSKRARVPAPFQRLFPSVIRTNGPRLILLTVGCAAALAFISGGTYLLSHISNKPPYTPAQPVALNEPAYTPASHASAEPTTPSSAVSSPATPAATAPTSPSASTTPTPTPSHHAGSGLTLLLSRLLQPVAQKSPVQSGTPTGTLQLLPGIL